MKAQLSTELLIIVALVLLIFIPLLVLVYFKANETNQQIASYQAELAVSRIAYLANSVGSLGTSTSLNTDIYLPKNMKYLKTITSTSGRGGEIALQIETPQGPSDIVEIVRYPIVKPGTLADSSRAGGWLRLRLSSEYVAETGEARIKIETTG